MIDWKKYQLMPWEPHQHQAIPEYWIDGKTYRTDVKWPCKLCGAPCDPWDVNIWMNRYVGVKDE